MPIHGLNHINIRTPDYLRTVAFMEGALGMRVTAIPGHGMIEKAAWVHDETGAPILHIASADTTYSPTEILPAVPPRGSGAVHHIALTCRDYGAMKQRLVAGDFTFRENVPEPGLRQIFVQDPTGITFELNFSAG